MNFSTPPPTWRNSLRLLLPLLVGLGIARATFAGAVWRGLGNSASEPMLGQSLPPVANIVTSNYYVSSKGSDSGDGSVSHPWGTIAHAAVHASPGAVIHVAPGVYLQSVETSASGTAVARVRFVSDIKWAAKVSAEAYTAWKNTGSYVDIEGFDITGNGCNGINNEGTHVRIALNRVHDIPAPSSLCGNNGGSGIADSNYTASDNDVIGNVVYSVGSPQHPNQLVQGIYHSNRGGQIVDNLVYGVAAWGICTWHAAREVTIANNTVVNNGAGGILVGAGDAPGGIVNDDTTVTNNIVAWNRGYGISENSATGKHNLYRDNLVYRNEVGGIFLQNGLRASGTINADPQFVAYTGGNDGDYHLKPTSPAANRCIGERGAASDSGKSPWTNETQCAIGAYPPVANIAR